MALQLLKENQVAEMLGLSVQTLRNDRSLGRKIPYIKIGASVRYSVLDVEQYLEACRISRPSGDLRDDLSKQKKPLTAGTDHGAP